MNDLAARLHFEGNSLAIESSQGAGQRSRQGAQELGQIRDTYKRGWLTRWWDQFGPF